MGFNVTCMPGRDAAVAFMQVTPNLPETGEPHE